MNGDDYMERFGGIGRLYGASGLQRLRAARVMVVGIGGVGSWVAEALARSGVGAIDLVDLDDICVTNINRQIHALESTVGASKIKTMEKRLKEISPMIRVIRHDCFYGERTADGCLSQPLNVVIDAIDNARLKAHLLAQARQRGMAAVCVGGAGGRIDPAKIRTDDLSRSHGDPLLQQVRKRLRSEHEFEPHGRGRFRIPCVFSDEPPRFPWADGSIRCERPEDSPTALHCDAGLGSITHVTATMGMFAAAAAMQLITAELNG